VALILLQIAEQIREHNPLGAIRQTFVSLAAVRSPSDPPLLQCLETEQIYLEEDKNRSLLADAIELYIAIGTALGFTTKRLFCRCLNVVCVSVVIGQDRLFDVRL
jgi:predicted house-cleaning noncanonical NTP pyrophosphatase (MazG superfamily)